MVPPVDIQIKREIHDASILRSKELLKLQKS
jgi:hypothetical protein